MNKKNALAFGIIIGTVIGIITDNLALWLALGVAFGAAGMVKASKDEKEDTQE
ncbi:hypothetical protein [Balneola sp. EhC07]|uniref:hypothetical protein n=1 Tax=Balneola sp. EhC07 TaxID=1849360 RepID=UPI001913D413|nr:hypothetical protein [Balneola sp. EhC07]